MSAASKLKCIIRIATQRTLGRVCIALLLAGVTPMLLKAVIVAPTALFLSNQNRNARVTLYNSGTVPEEITLQVQYGYPEIDSVGNIAYRLIEHPDSTAPSAASFVSAYPRRLLLAPGTRQTVRLLAAPPASLQNREYWARLVVTSANGADANADSANPTLKIGMSMQMRTVIPVFYRHGEMRTGVQVKGLQATLTRDSVIIQPDLERTGNAAFLGSAQFELRDASGRVRGNWRLPVSIHFEKYRRRFVFPVEETLVPGKYELRVTLTPDRPDLSSTNILSTPRATFNAMVELK